MWLQFVADFWQISTFGCWALTEHTLMTLYLLFVVNQLLMAPELSVTGWLLDGLRRLRRRRRHPAHG